MAHGENWQRGPEEQTFENKHCPEAEANRPAVHGGSKAARKRKLTYGNLMRRHYYCCLSPTRFSPSVFEDAGLSDNYPRCKKEMTEASKGFQKRLCKKANVVEDLHGTAWH